MMMKGKWWKWWQTTVVSVSNEFNTSATHQSPFRGTSMRMGEECWVLCLITQNKPHQWKQSMFCIHEYYHCYHHCLSTCYYYGFCFFEHIYLDNLIVILHWNTLLNPTIFKLQTSKVHVLSMFLIQTLISLICSNWTVATSVSLFCGGQW